MAGTRYHFDNTYWDFPMVKGAYVLYQIGDICCKSNFEIKEHVQQVHEISYVVSGHGRMWIDDVPICVYPRMAILNKIGDRHRIATGDGEKLRFFYLGFGFSTPVCTEAVKVLDSFFENLDCRVIYNVANLQEDFINLFDEILRQDVLFDVMVESCIHKILSNVYRAYMSKESLSYHLDYSDTLDVGLVHDVVLYIDSHAEDGALLSSLSGKFGYSYGYLARKFTFVTGESLQKYYSRRRFEQACKFLRQGVNVTDVAERMGYASIHAFSSAFKKRMGISPSQYQQKKQDEPSE